MISVTPATATEQVWVVRDEFSRVLDREHSVQTAWSCLHEWGWMFGVVFLSLTLAGVSTAVGSVSFAMAGFTFLALCVAAYLVFRKGLVRLYQDRLDALDCWEQGEDVVGVSSWHQRLGRQFEYARARIESLRTLSVAELEAMFQAPSA